MSWIGKFLFRLGQRPTIKPLLLLRIRALWSLRAQVLAVALVVGSGVAIFVMMHGILSSLESTRSNYYNQHQLADVWASAVRIPAPIVDRIRDHPAIFRIEPRIKSGIQLDMGDNGATIKAQILSLKYGTEPLLNKPYLTAGGWPGIEPGHILIANEFAKAHQLKPGDKIYAVIYGVRRELTIAGTAMSPEFIYAIPPGELIPDAARFAQVWMAEKALANAFDMDGAFNEITIRLKNGANQTEVIAALDRLLSSYGGIGAFGRDQHLSDRFIESEFTQLKTLGSLLPLIFLGVAAFLLNILTTRIVEQERKEIGLMKAFGYSDRAIIVHYLYLSLIMVGTGVFVGLMAGNAMGRAIAAEYQIYYHFPVLIFDPDKIVYIQAASLAFFAAVFGAFISVRKLKGLRPAVAMAPAIPTDYSSNIGVKAAWMDEGFRLVLRHLFRWPWRSVFTTLGISFAMMIVVGAHSMFDGINHMMHLQFNVINRQDVTVSFTEKESWSAIHEIETMEGVLAVEPFLAVPASFSHGLQVKNMALTGLPQDIRLSRLVDDQNQPVAPPTFGLTLSKSMADLLGAEKGDNITVQVLTGKRRQLTLPVAEIVTTWIGIGAYMPLDTLFDMLGEGPRLSGVHLLIDHGKDEALIRAFRDMPQVIGVGRNDEAKQSMRSLMDQNLNTMNAINSFFASMIAFGVIFSSARIMVSERYREIATLKVIGFTNREINQMLIGEIGILTLIAMPVGIGLSKIMVAGVIKAMESELFRMPEMTSWSTIGQAVIVISISLIISSIFVVKSVKKLDKIAALQTAG